MLLLLHDSWQVLLINLVYYLMCISTLFVHLVVSWKIPEDYTGDESYFKPSWLVAECLNQHSLARAFKKFPMDADPRRSSTETESTDVELKTPEPQDYKLKEEDFSDDEDEESEDEDVEVVEADEFQEIELEDTGKSDDTEDSDIDVSHLENSGEIDTACFVLSTVLNLTSFDLFAKTTKHQGL